MSAQVLVVSLLVLFCEFTKTVSAKQIVSSTFRPNLAEFSINSSALMSFASFRPSFFCSILSETRSHLVPKKIFEFDLIYFRINTS